jgi:hypothetical protein
MPSQSHSTVITGRNPTYSALAITGKLLLPVSLVLLLLLQLFLLLLLDLLSTVLGVCPVVLAPVLFS